MMRTLAHALCLSQQAMHSDHRRKIDAGLFSSHVSFNQNHAQWKSAEEWVRAGKSSIDVPNSKKSPRPRSFLFSFLPKTSVVVTPKGGGAPVSTQVPLGCFFAFDGHVNPPRALFLKCQFVLTSQPGKTWRRCVSSPTSTPAFLCARERLKIPANKQV